MLSPAPERYPAIRGTAAVALACLMIACSPAPEEPERAPDVILIVIDTMRADRLGCYGYPGQVSPNIDGFAAESVVFENALSHAADTRFSCAAMMSGFLPHETRILERPDLPYEVTTLSERLQDQGYETAAVVSNYVLRFGQGFEQGFDTYDATMQQTEITRLWPERVATRTTDRAIEILNQPRDRPLFLWVHYQDPHGPYVPPTRYVEAAGSGEDRSIPFNDSLSGRGGIPEYQRLEDHDRLAHYSAQYDGEVRYLDEHFARLVEAMKTHGVYDRGIVALTSDHGEGMGEHDYYFAHGE